ncbi:MAG: ABC transporter permease [Candidatus Binatota bacterium]|jgi:phospholipid/cholesterol/gamma-HCH transport system permease protein
MREITQKWGFKGLYPIEAASEYLGGLGLLCYEVGRRLHKRWEGQLILGQMERIGVRSLSIVLLTAVFTGMVLALQMGNYLTRFGAKPYAGRILALSMLREMGPVLTALMIGGRVGAGITAELGSMQVTEQIDAMRSLGINPVQKLVLPRLAALMIMLPLLTVLADFVGVMGGLFISVMELDISADFYLNSIIQFIKFQDLFSGLGKTFFFAFFIGIIACYNGLQVTGGADGVGQATTQTVVTTSITTLVSDFFLTKLFLQL